MRKNHFKPILLSMLILFILLSCEENTHKQTELISISVKTPPSRVQYYTSEKLDFTGLKISLTFDNGNTEDLVYSDFESRKIATNPENGTTLNESKEVTITHTPTGVKTSLTVTVSSVVIDIEGNTYSIVKIGDQLWLGENLKTTKYNNGTSIALEENDIAWSSLSTAAFCWYDNNKTMYGDTYGALYNWYTVDTKKLCPIGWHVPTDEEWTTLVELLGGEDVAGGSLKESGTSHWNYPNEGANNSSGFTGLPSGSRSDLFHSLGEGARWWSSTQFDATNSSALSVSYTYGTAFWYNYTKSHGYSVRCIRD
ncbi:MAG: fibrobacter succinogenes major paralogous domain-containing protein [Bacteroidales bacterium]|nr:fibrobacter succinogenes major paralogous domain-containing protein [Bacteroidales bacterium]